MLEPNRCNHCHTLVIPTIEATCPACRNPWATGDQVAMYDHLVENVVTKASIRSRSPYSATYVLLNLVLWAGILIGLMSCSLGILQRIPIGFILLRNLPIFLFCLNSWIFISTLKMVRTRIPDLYENSRRLSYPLACGQLEAIVLLVAILGFLAPFGFCIVAGLSTSALVWNICGVVLIPGSYLLSICALLMHRLSMTERMRV